MSTRGPCLCGDPFCPSCGSPMARAQIAVEEAQEKLFERCQENSLTPEEYDILFDVGMKAVANVRSAITKEYERQRFLAAEERSMEAVRQAMDRPEIDLPY